MKSILMNCIRVENSIGWKATVKNVPPTKPNGKSTQLNRKVVLSDSTSTWLNTI